MAYSLNDVYRYLRLVMRADAVVLGLGLGLLLAIVPLPALAAWGIFGAGPGWPVRLAGGLLITLGVTLLLAAQERIVSGPNMIGMSLGNGVVAMVLLAAYLQQQFAMLNLVGRILLIGIFIVCLIGTLFPIHFLRAEYQAP